jgi:ring-1,2-phenylacetyl-CoA epoxidase subunit PaaA
MFGPSDKDSPNSAELTKWGVKRKGNDELRQRFVNLTVAQAQAINLTLPDPDLKYNEATGNWDFGAIDWEEFQRVLKGDGPCNRERIAARRDAHEAGAWVRVAASAYAAKRTAEASTEAA